MRRDLILELSEIEEILKRTADELDCEWVGLRLASELVENQARKIGAMIERLKLEE